MAEPLHRSKFSDDERSFRSRIAQLASSHLFVRGTFSDRTTKCGKPNCHCATGVLLHPSIYLVQSHDGKLRQNCLPKAWRERERQAVKDYQEMQSLIELVSELEWKRLLERKP